MTSERYQQINDLADAVLGMSAAERAAFLERSCAGDQELRERVEELVRAHSSDDTFLQTPLFEVLAKDMANASPRKDLTGQTIGHYEVISRLGTGGIGEVWLARDIELDREVALKLLSPMSAADRSHVRRFQHEARAASTLNHPNIVTIYEIGRSGSSEFIAQEFVRGETVRQHVAKGPMTIESVLRVGSQIASALSAAHNAGIVHRDIKPENVMIRPDGLVKVLDFGLARPIERQPADRSRPKNTLTRPGFVMGTVRYMSPEQARGLPVDFRSDLFSLGVMLYEMATGTPPFSGPTPTDTLAAVLRAEPAPLSRYLRDVPQSFQSIIWRCLEKHRDKRCKSANELRDELDRLAQELARPPITHRNRWRMVLPVVLPAVALLLAALYFILVAKHAAAPFTSMRMVRLSTRDNAVDGAISPDGRYFAYVVNEARGQSVWTAQLASSSEIETVPPEAGRHSGLAFSPDGAYLYYGRRVGDESSNLYRVPALGGAAVKLIANLAGAVSISPDGSRLAFVRLDPSHWKASLVITNSDGTGERIIASRRRPQFLDQHSVAWSPDGRSIACFAGQAKDYSSAFFNLSVIRVADGAQELITAHRFAWPQSISWLPRRDTLVVTAAPTLGDEDRFQLWTVERSNGRVSRLTNDLSSYGRVTATSDGRALLAVQGDTLQDIWVSPASEVGSATRVTATSVHSPRISVAWTPEGRLVYSEAAGEYRELWMVDADGGNRKRLTSGPTNKDEAAVSPDGRYIVYLQNGNVWRMDANGANPRQLTYGPLDVHPDVTTDSRTVVYASFVDWSPAIGGEPTLWQVPIDGGKPIQIAKQPASLPQVSPDGKRIACMYFPARDPRLPPFRIGVVSREAGGAFSIFQGSPSDETRVLWDPHGKAVDYIMNTGRLGNIWRQPLANRPAAPLTDFTTDELFTFAWSRDGRRLAYARGRTSCSVVRIDEF